MKKIAIILFLAFVELAGFGQTIPTTNSDVIWESGYTFTGGKYYFNNNFGGYSTDFEIIKTNPTQLANITAGFVDCKDSTMIVMYGVDTMAFTQLWWNFNDADTLYFEHLEHDTLVTGVESSPFRLNAFAHYTTPTDARIYFSGIEITGTMKTVCASGCGYTLHSTAIAGASATDTIVSYSGTYAETNSLTINKNVKLFNIGNAKIKCNTASTFTVNMSAAGAKLHGYNLLPNTTTYAVRQSTTSSTVENCYLHDFGSGCFLLSNDGINVIKNVVVNDATVNYVYFGFRDVYSEQNYYSASLAVYVWGNATQTDYEIYSYWDKYRLGGNGKIGTAAGLIFYMKGADYYVNSLNTPLLGAVRTTGTGFVEIDGCNFEVDTMLTSAKFYNESTATTAFLKILNTGYTCNSIQNTGFIKKTGKGIYIDGLTTDMDFSAMDIQNCDSLMTVNNSVLSWDYPPNNSSPIISFVSSTVSSTPITVKGNVITGGTSIASGYGGHAKIYTYDYSNFTIEHNYLWGLGLGAIIVKMNGTGTSYGSNISYNDCIGAGILNRGNDSILISNNTIRDYGNAETPYGINIYFGDDNNDAHGNMIYNNIIDTDTTSGGYAYRFYYANVDSLNDLYHAIDYNVINDDSLALINDFFTITNWTAWQDTIDGELHSLNIDPLLNANGTPTNGLVIGKALNLGSPNNVGIDPSATYPDPLLKNQFAKWTAGVRIPNLNTVATSNSKVILFNNRFLKY